jgi:CheY-like chemotaxis protein
MASEPSGGRVLVVDDDKVNRMLRTRSLEREAHRVRCGTTGPRRSSCSTMTRSFREGAPSR